MRTPLRGGMLARALHARHPCSGGTGGRVRLGREEGCRGGRGTREVAAKDKGGRAVTPHSLTSLTSTPVAAPLGSAFADASRSSGRRPSRAVPRPTRRLCLPACLPTHRGPLRCPLRRRPRPHNRRPRHRLPQLVCWGTARIPLLKGDGQAEREMGLGGAPSSGRKNPNGATHALFASALPSNPLCTLASGSHSDSRSPATAFAAYRRHAPADSGATFAPSLACSACSPTTTAPAPATRPARRTATAAATAARAGRRRARGQQ